MLFTAFEDFCKYLARLTRIGTTVTTVGQVEKDPALPAGQFTIFRFVVVRCAADAMPCN